MTRALSFEYNAVLAIAELVVDRLIGALYDEQSLPDTHTAPVLGGTAHLWMNKPSFRLDAMRPDCNAVLSVDELKGLVRFSGAADQEFTAGVEVEFALQIDELTQTLRPDFLGLTTDDVTATTDNAIVAALLPTVLVNELRGGSFSALELPLNLGEEVLASDRCELRLIDDESVTDQDTVNLGLYNSTDADSRGHPDDVTNFILDDKTFTVRISQTAFDLLVQERIDRRFMRFDLTVPATTQTIHHVRIGPPDFASGLVTLEGHSHTEHSGVAGDITNARTSERVGFYCDAAGQFRATIAARPGDVLEVRGTSVMIVAAGRSVVVYPPSLTLRDGYVSIHGDAFFNELGSVEAEIDGAIRFEINPATGHVIASADAEVELPAWVDIILFCVGVSVDAELERYIVAEFGEMGASLLPAVGEADRLVAFWENIELRSDGIILSGQLEAGRIESAGRTYHAVVGVGDSTSVTLDLEHSSVSVRGGMHCSLGTIAFEQLGVDNLIGLPYSGSDITLPDPPHLDGHVLAVRTGGGCHGKLRLNVLDDGRTISRWVTYRPLIEPLVALSGEWHQDPEPFGVSREGIVFNSVGANRYWGEFSVSLMQRLYDARGAEPEFRWAPYTGPGELTILDDGRRVSL